MSAHPLPMPELMWVIGDTTYDCPILSTPCPFCGKKRITVLPPPVAAKQSDGTTHVCHPSIGGCNHGFEMTKPFEPAKVRP